MSFRALERSRQRLAIPDDLVEVYSSQVKDPVPRDVVIASIVNVRRLAEKVISDWKAHVDAVDAQTIPSSRQYIGKEIEEANIRVIEAEAILHRAFDFYFVVEQLPSDDVPGEMTVVVDKCLADAEAMDAELCTRKLSCLVELSQLTAP